MTRRAGVFACGALTVVLLAACGSDSVAPYSQPTGPAVKTLAVEAENFAFIPDTLTSPAGIVQVDLTSTAGLHNFVLEGVPQFQVEATSGSSSSGKVKLKPGKYTFYCNIAGHRAQGMEGILTVK